MTRSNLLSGISISAMVLCTGMAYGQTTYQGGPWNNAGSWTNGVPGTAPGNLDAIIPNGFIAQYVSGNPLDSVVIEAGAKLIIPATQSGFDVGTVTLEQETMADIAELDIAEASIIDNLDIEAGAVVNAHDSVEVQFATVGQSSGSDGVLNILSGTAVQFEVTNQLLIDDAGVVNVGGAQEGQLLLTGTGANALQVNTLGLIQAESGSTIEMDDASGFSAAIDGVMVLQDATLSAKESASFSGSGTIAMQHTSAVVQIARTKTMTNNLVGGIVGQGSIRGVAGMGAIAEFVNNTKVESDSGTLTLENSANFVDDPTTGVSEWRVPAGSTLVFNRQSLALEGDFIVGGTLDINANVETGGNASCSSGGTIITATSTFTAFNGFVAQNKTCACSSSLFNCP